MVETINTIKPINLNKLLSFSFPRFDFKLSISSSNLCSMSSFNIGYNLFVSFSLSYSNTSQPAEIGITGSHNVTWVFLWPRYENIAIDHQMVPLFFQNFWSKHETNNFCCELSRKINAAISYISKEVPNKLPWFFGCEGGGVRWSPCQPDGH